MKEDIINHEEQLKVAMLTSDVALLDKLISPELIFTNHFGQIITKEQDLAAHQSGQLKINSLRTSDKNIILRDAIAIVSVRTDIQGTYAGHSANGNFRFTRVWEQKENNHWQIIAGHSCLIHDL